MSQQQNLQDRPATQDRLKSIDRSKLAPAQIKGLEIIETRRNLHELKLMILHRSEKNMEITVRLIQKWLAEDDELAKEKEKLKAMRG